MTNLIPPNTTLFGQVVDLIPLNEGHFNELNELSKDKRIWEFYVFDGTNPERFSEILNAGIKERERGTQFPFVIYHKQHKKIVGVTRFLDIQPQHKKLEIGGTWLHPDYWGTPVNGECKLLLLTFCFENLGVQRVQLKTDENNLRSRQAIQKIGGQFEGILRNDMIRDNGTNRNSAYYSIIISEWNDLKIKSTLLFENKKDEKA